MTHQGDSGKISKIFPESRLTTILRMRKIWADGKRNKLFRRKIMVTIIEACPAAGYSSWDHLLTGREADGVIGLTFRTVKAACEAADREVEKNADHRAVSSGAHIVLSIRMADGSIIRRTT
jgi:hypothetical protein